MRRAYSARSWMLGATTAVSRRTGGLLSSGGDELGDGFVEQLRLLPLDPVSALRHGAVAVEAAPQGARLGEGVHEALYLFVRPERLVVGPVGEAVAEVYLRRPAAGADKLLGQGELVEEHVPDLAEAVRREEAGADPRVGRLEEYEAVHQMRVGAGESLCPDGAEVVGDDGYLLEAEVLHQRAQVFGHDLVGIALLRRQVRLFGVGVAAHVRDDDIEPPGEGLDVHVPLVPEAGPAVNEEEGRADAFADVVIAQAVYRGVFVVEAIGLAQAGEAPIRGGGGQFRSTLFGGTGSVKPACR